jgi:superfamily I DNA/RNA helicase
VLAVESFHTIYKHPVMILLVRAREFVRAERPERRRINSLNYGDLLNLTARVLLENELVRRALQQKFRYLPVDEFQDTDPVQAEILFWLAEDSALSSGMKTKDGDWRNLPPAAWGAVCRW